MAHWATGLEGAKEKCDAYEAIKHLVYDTDIHAEEFEAFVSSIIEGTEIRLDKKQSKRTVNKSPYVHPSGPWGDGSENDRQVDEAINECFEKKQRRKK